MCGRVVIEIAILFSFFSVELNSRNKKARTVLKMTSEMETKFTKNSIDLAFELFTKLSDGNQLKNIVFSPFSVQCCVALAHAGARGETCEEIAKGLKLISSDKTQVGDSFCTVLDTYRGSDILKIANKIYVKTGYKLKREFNELAKNKYHSEAEEINFIESESAAVTINQWVKDKTNGKITKLISSNNLNDSTSILLLNAIHFKGQWKNKFDEKNTKEDIFWINEKESTKIQMMSKRAKFRYGVFDDIDCKGLEMGYKDSNLSMIVILPNKRDGLQKLTGKLKNVNMIELNNCMFEKEVVVKFPKFKVDFSVELSDVLKKMGVAKMFSSKSEFEDMLESTEKLSVSNVVHKAFIEVNEEGTEAAAATGTIRMKRCVEMPLEFTANHPFLYIIWDNRTVLFAGCYVDSE